jgi:hypothetical protein
VVDWRDRHPVLQHLNLANLAVARCHKLALPRNALVLSEFAQSPCMAVVDRAGSAFVLVGFDVMETNWPFEPSFVMFCYNAVHYLGMEIAQARQRALKVGEAITVRAKPGGEDARLMGPGGLDEKIGPDASGTVRYGKTHRVGVYSVALPGRPIEQFAVNLLDAAESDVVPAAEINLSGDRIGAEEAAVRRSAEELWPLLVAAVLVLACVEWLVYNSKVRL